MVNVDYLITSNVRIGLVSLNPVTNVNDNPLASGDLKRYLVYFKILEVLVTSSYKLDCEIYGVHIS